MNSIRWLKPTDCELLQPDLEDADLESLLRVQKLLRLLLSCENSRELMEGALEHIALALQADCVCVVEATPQWPICQQYQGGGSRAKRNPLPRSFMSEVLDRNAAGSQAKGNNTRAFAATPLTREGRTNQILLASRSSSDFTAAEFEYLVAAGFYLRQFLESLQAEERQSESLQRLQALLSISEQLVEERETVPLLEHIAEQATRLLGCERASIFLWDQTRQELVGRPALGLPGGELRIADDVGVVGRVVQSGQMLQVDDVRADPTWNPDIDDASGFQTLNLLCVPLNDGEGKQFGAFEVMNKKAGRFSEQDVETLQALGRQTIAALQNVREREALLRSNAEFEVQARQGCRIIGESVKISELRRTLATVARTELPVLILGESGTGKDVVARAIHYSSTRQNQPFIPVNCAAIAETLLESELFGHEKGAFTDAHTQRAGKFEVASGGTLFLDEIGDLSAGGQAKLLRVLEEKVVYRVGGSQPIPVDTRIIAATNRNLAERVQHHKFREDLFYRLSVVTLELPPLRERQDDVLLLAEYFLRQFCRDAGRKLLKLSAEAKKRLQQHDWPGNVRELRNLLERVAYLCQNERVEASDVPFISRPLAELADDYSHLPLRDATDAFQINHISNAIKRANGNMSDAAALLGLHRPNLYRKMRSLQMDVTED